jgi:hypothetical protein
MRTDVGAVEGSVVGAAGGGGRLSRKLLILRLTTRGL